MNISVELVVKKEKIQVNITATRRDYVRTKRSKLCTKNSDKCNKNGQKEKRNIANDVK